MKIKLIPLTYVIIPQGKETGSRTHKENENINIFSPTFMALSEPEIIRTIIKIQTPTGKWIVLSKLYFQIGCLSHYHIK